MTLLTKCVTADRWRQLRGRVWPEEYHIYKYLPGYTVTVTEKIIMLLMMIRVLIIMINIISLKLLLLLLREILKIIKNSNNEDRIK